MISSAVLIPEAPSPEPAQQSNGSLKRRQSAVSESSDTKRPRLDTQPSSTASTNGEVSPSTITHGQGGQGAMSPPAPRRRQTSTAEQDKSRNRRLFGALLGTLSQSSQPARRASASTATKSNISTASVSSRREEIESRQRERLRRESQDIAESARLKREKLDRERRNEQARWDEEAMRLRHRNMRATARFLQTKTEPRLYYKPWELRDFEVDDIKHQVEDVEGLIAEEVKEFEEKKRRRDEERKEGEQTSASSNVHQPSTTEDGNGTMDVDDDLHEAEKKPVSQREAPEDDRQNQVPSARVKTNSDHSGDSEPPDASTEGRQYSRQLVAEVEGGRPTTSSKSDEHDDGEELEQGQEDDVIY